MNNNDVFRRLRYIFDLRDEQMLKLFGHASYSIGKTELLSYLSQEEEEIFKMMSDQALAAFLNGLIVEKRGRKDDATIMNEKRINNNIVFRKLKIALNFRDDDIVDVLKLVDLRVSKHEISAIFRGQNQKQYRPCKDQFLRNFLMGLQMKYRNTEE